jgi:hypothetical protein
LDGGTAAINPRKRLIMSQSPIYYASPNPYPSPINRPTVVTVLGIIGIVFGALGVLCLGFGELIAMFSLANPHMFRAMQQQPMDHRIANLIIGFIGLILSGVLLFASIGSMSLKPVARQVMLGFALVDIVFVLLRLLTSIFIFIPHVQDNPALHQGRNAPQMIMFAKLAGAIGAVIGWLVPTVFDVLVLIFFRKPEIVEAFENPPQNPNANLPLPPM